jgi:hypothetical protein
MSTRENFDTRSGSSRINSITSDPNTWDNIINLDYNSVVNKLSSLMPGFPIIRIKKGEKRPAPDRINDSILIEVNEYNNVINKPIIIKSQYEITSDQNTWVYLVKIDFRIVANKLRSLMPGFDIVSVYPGEKPPADIKNNRIIIFVGEKNMVTSARIG